MKGNIHRIGNFTSSQIYRLCGVNKKNGEKTVAFQTYVDEKNLERRLNVSIETEGYSTSMAWGTFLQTRVHDLLGMEYRLFLDETQVHPEISCWAGSKDLDVENVKVSELKCFEVKNFAYFTDAILKRDTEHLKAEFEKEYWQAVSNAIINGVSKAELISYCPYLSELDEIKEAAINYIEPDAWKYRFIYERSPEGLAHIQDNGYYKNLNKFEFEIPQADREFLTNRVLEAQKLLKPFHKVEELITN